MQIYIYIYKQEGLNWTETVSQTIFGVPVSESHVDWLTLVTSSGFFGSWHVRNAQDLPSDWIGERFRVVIISDFSTSAQDLAWSFESSG